MHHQNRICARTMDAILSDIHSGGFLDSFLSNNLKTNQLEVNTDAKTLRPIARLKEPRELFALPKDKDNECGQQAARWPIECQVFDERIHHIEYVPEQPEPYAQPTGKEIQPRPVGDENGMIVYIYNPVSAVNYTSKSSSTELRWNHTKDHDGDDESNSDLSRSQSPLIGKLSLNNNNNNKKSSLSPDNDNNDDEDDEDNDEDNNDSVLIHNNRSLSSDSELHGRCTTTTHGVAQHLDTAQLPLAPSSTQPSLHTCSTGGDKLIDCTRSDTQHPLSFAQFSRSSVGGSKFLLDCHPTLNTTTTTTTTTTAAVSGDGDENCDLLFESRFESGNLAKAVKITVNYYELTLRPDMYTNRHTQWFYFRVTNTRKNVIYRFSIVNLMKSGSLYNEGMRPLMYSTMDAATSLIGWRRCGENVTYYKNDDSSSSTDDEEDNSSFTLTFNIKFTHDKDTVYFAHSYPYTYTDLQEYLLAIQRHPFKSKYCKLRLLCRSLAGNNVYYLTVTAPSDEEPGKKRKAIIISARVHPGETPSSWMMKGLMDFLTGDSLAAKKLRHKFIFKLIPMLNPDGVIVGNTRSSLTGKDLNRQYRTVIRETYPSIWYTKAMIKRLMEDCGVAIYCDLHAHSRKHNVFIYGCENKRNVERRLWEQVFPLMLHKNVADKFSFENCKFKIQKNKEGTGRIVVWMLGIMNSYTMEASFGGTTMTGTRNGTHFSTADYEQCGRAFCETLLDYADDNPAKVKIVHKRLRKLRKRERKLRKAAKMAKKLADTTVSANGHSDDDEADVVVPVASTKNLN